MDLVAAADPDHREAPFLRLSLRIPAGDLIHPPPILYFQSRFMKDLLDNV